MTDTPNRNPFTSRAEARAARARQESASSFSLDEDTSMIPVPERPARAYALPEAPAQPQAQTQPPMATYSAPAATPAPPNSGAVFGEPTLDDVLRAAVASKASDIHFSVRTPIRVRIDGDLANMETFGTEPLTDGWMERHVLPIMNDGAREHFIAHHEADVSYSILNFERFRVNIFQQRSNLGSVFRVIPTKILTIEQLGVPDSLNQIAKMVKGLILVTGPTGSGKSTTLTAMIDSINRTRPDHIMTIEDPIEFVHDSKMSLINQREVGHDTESFKEALKRVLRQDPDVILVGELRDPETIAIALTAAETGHLVFGTLHTQSAVKTIDRIIDSFPSEQQNQIRSQLADTLQAVISQSLLKKKGGGRVAATEIMMRTDGIAALIRGSKVEQIYSDIQAGKAKGMHTLDQDLLRLVKDNVIEAEEARPYMRDQNQLNNLVEASEGNSGSWG